MTTEATTTSFVVSIASAACVLILSLPHLSPLIHRCFSSNRKYQAVGEIYEDKDGRASDDSQAAFSDFVQQTTLIVASVIGLALSAASAVLNLTQRNSSDDVHLVVQQWLQFATWVCWSLFFLLTSEY